jgi:hypothetical protein
MGTDKPLKAPFPYFGGKSKIAPLIWERFGDVPNYVEPFAGSLAVLLARPHSPKVETINDLDGFIINFWRAVALDPYAVARHADWPVMELDLHARHAWLVEQEPELVEKLRADPHYYDPKIAGWWVWGISAWIGSGWCRTQSQSLKIPNLRNGGMGVHRQSLQMPHLSDTGRGVHRATLQHGRLVEYFQQLAARLRYVRMTCGDWSRVLGPAVTHRLGITGVFLDPPYEHKGRHRGVYKEDRNVAADARQWCLENGDNPMLRIALCGYEGEGHEILEQHGWSVVSWKASGGYGLQGNEQGRENRNRERIWFSPHCIGNKLSAERLFAQTPIRGSV